MRFLFLLLFASGSVASPLDPREVAQRLADGEGPACLAVGVVGAVSVASLHCHPKAAPPPFAGQSLFEIGSITKGLTGLLLADMVLRGEVRLDDPASRHSRPGAKLPTRGGRQITLRDLVTHTAGLPLNPPTLIPRDRRDAYADFDVDDLYVALASTTPASDIGTTHSYSNFGFMWLSEMLSRAGGQPFPELLERRVLQPLGMGTASLEIPAEREKLRVVGHSPRYAPTPAWHFKPGLAGMGGVHASIEDMERLAEALAGRRKTPLDDAIGVAVAPLFKMNDVDSIGYAWMTRRVANAMLVWHSGGTGGFSSMLVADRARNVAAVVLADSAAQFQDLAFHLVEPTYPLQPRRVPLPVDAATRRAAAGSYAVAGDAVLKIYEEGESLLICCTQMQTWPVELAREGPNSFSMSGFPIKVKFMRDAQGAIYGLAIDASGRTFVANRVP